MKKSRSRISFTFLVLFVIVGISMPVTNYGLSVADERSMAEGFEMKRRKEWPRRSSSDHAKPMTSYLIDAWRQSLKRSMSAQQAIGSIVSFHCSLSEFNLVSSHTEYKYKQTI